MISIIIPTYNSLIVDKSIESVLKQIVDDTIEIIVVGVDNFHLIKDDYLIKRINTYTKCPPAKARNLGAINARGDILVFLDSDCIAPQDWLSKLLNLFTHENIIAIGGGVRFPEVNYWTIADNISMFHDYLFTGKQKSVNFVPSLNFAVKKSCFMKVKGFNEEFEFPSGEDFELTFRLSKIGRIIFNPNAWVFHQPPRATFFAMLKHSFIQGKFSIKIMNKERNLFYFVFLNKISLLIFSPFLALLATINIFLHKDCLKYIYTLPAIFFAKIAWCLGAFTSPWHNSKGYKAHEKDNV